MHQAFSEYCIDNNTGHNLGVCFMPISPKTGVAAIDFEYPKASYETAHEHHKTDVQQDTQMYDTWTSVDV